MAEEVPPGSNSVVPCQNGAGFVLWTGPGCGSGDDDHAAPGSRLVVADDGFGLSLAPDDLGAEVAPRLHWLAQVASAEAEVRVASTWVQARPEAPEVLQQAEELLVAAAQEQLVAVLQGLAKVAVALASLARRAEAHCLGCCHCCRRKALEPRPQGLVLEMEVAPVAEVAAAVASYVDEAAAVLALALLEPVREPEAAPVAEVAVALVSEADSAAAAAVPASLGPVLVPEAVPVAKVAAAVSPEADSAAAAAAVAALVPVLDRHCCCFRCSLAVGRWQPQAPARGS